MTAPVRLTDAERKLLRDADYESRESGRIGVVFAAVQAILADRLPEATTVTEWGVRCPSSDRTYQYGKSYEYVLGTLQHDGDQIVRRQRTRYADHVGPWEEAPSPQTSTDRKAQR